MAKRKRRKPQSPPEEASPRRRFLAQAGRPTGLALASALALWLAFPPVNAWPLAWVALVPLVVALRSDRPPRAIYVGVWLGGFAFFLAAVHWLRYADAKAWLAWMALAFYLSLYWVALAWLVRRGTGRLGLPAAIVVPVVSVSLDFLRAHLLTGFAWYYLGHTQYPNLRLIQVADLGGVYAVTFLLAAVNGLLADLWVACRAPAPQRRALVRRRWAPMAAATVLLGCAVVAYGWARIDQIRKAWTPGPKVAVIQGNETQRAKSDPKQAVEVLRRHFHLSEQAAADKPDLIVWPETMFTQPWLLFAEGLTQQDLDRQGLKGSLTDLREWRTEIHGLLGILKHAVDRAAGDSPPRLVIGINTQEFRRDRLHKTNSALYLSERAELYAKDLPESRLGEKVLGRYDKIHLVPFGEYLPLADVMPWLNMFTPYREGYSLEAGTEPTVFRLGEHRFGVIICFEDTVPRVCRRFVRPENGPKRVDFLVNISNDGWFAGSSELDAHLALCVFRAVENHVTILRAVNTGISANILPDGAIAAQVADATGRSKQVAGHLTARVLVDRSCSFYTRAGDLWACINVAGCVLMMIGACVAPPAARKKSGNSVD